MGCPRTLEKAHVMASISHGKSGEMSNKLLGEEIGRLSKELEKNGDNLKTERNYRVMQKSQLRLMAIKHFDKRFQRCVIFFPLSLFMISGGVK